MSARRRVPSLLSTGISSVLRVGTLLAIGTVVVGYLMGRLGGMVDGQRPVLEQIGDGGAAAIVAIGLLGLTVIPIGAVVVAIAGFVRGGEPANARTAGVVLVLLVGSLVAAALIAPPA